jgi:MFS family permease
MSGIMSAIGLGATVGTLLLPWASDKFGRKAVMALSSLGVLRLTAIAGQRQSSAAYSFHVSIPGAFFQ